MIEYFKPSFPYSNIEEKVDGVLILKEEAVVVYKAMSQAVEQRDEEIKEWIQEQRKEDIPFMRTPFENELLDNLLQFLNQKP